MNYFADSKLTHTLASLASLATLHNKIFMDTCSLRSSIKLQVPNRGCTKQTVKQSTTNSWMYMRGAYLPSLHHLTHTSKSPTTHPQRFSGFPKLAIDAYKNGSLPSILTATKT